MRRNASSPPASGHSSSSSIVMNSPSCVSARATSVLRTAAIPRSGATNTSSGQRYVLSRAQTSKPSRLSASLSATMIVTSAVVSSFSSAARSRVRLCGRRKVGIATTTLGMFAHPFALQREDVERRQPFADQDSTERPYRPSDHEQHQRTDQRCNTGQNGDTRETVERARALKERRIAGANRARSNDHRPQPYDRHHFARIETV